jgi:hypothetical protein
MQFFIALALLVTITTAYLVTQFLRRSLADTEAPTQEPAEEAETTLRAA